MAALQEVLCGVVIAKLCMLAALGRVLRQPVTNST